MAHVVPATAKLVLGPDGHCILIPKNPRRQLPSSSSYVTLL
jgi:hypothetical protein